MVGAKNQEVSARGKSQKVKEEKHLKGSWIGCVCHQKEGGQNQKLV